MTSFVYIFGVYGNICGHMIPSSDNTFFFFFFFFIADTMFNVGLAKDAFT